MNVASFIGNLATAPKLDKRSGTDRNGKEQQVCTFFVAVNERGDDKPANFLPVKTWNGQAGACFEHLTVGSEVAVTGRIVTSKYEKDGETKYGWEIVASEVKFLRRPKNAGDVPTSDSLSASTEEPVSTPASDDDIPF